jgi:type I restriction enzyme M protein
LEAEGKEIGQRIVTSGEKAPDAPAGGKVRLVPLSRIFPNEAFGYHAITVERPPRNEKSEILLGTKGKQKGKPQPDSSLRDTENVPLSEEVEAYFKREVLPHVPDAWIDEEKTKVGYEIRGVAGGHGEPGARRLRLRPGAMTVSLMRHSYRQGLMVPQGRAAS